MKTPLSLALGSALCLLLTSCVTDSLNPLSSPDTAHADSRLLGDWFDKDQDTHFSVTKGPWMHVVITTKQAAPNGRPSMIDLKPEAYDFFPTVIGKDTFLNVQMIGKDDQGHPTKSYAFLRYSISSDHVLQMWMMSEDLLAAAIRAGKLKGVVKPTGFISGQAAHVDVDVTLLDTTANIVKFIQSMDVTELFSEKMEPLYRVKPTDK